MKGDGERPKLRLIKTEEAKGKEAKKPKPKLPGPKDEGLLLAAGERPANGARRITPINSVRAELDALGLNMGTRIANVFLRGTIRISRGGKGTDVRVRCLEDLSGITRNEMLTVRNMWTKSVDALEEVMARRGIRFREIPPESGGSGSA